MLVHIGDIRRIVEIGAFTGFSAIAMAEAMLHDGRLITCEVEPGV